MNMSCDKVDTSGMDKLPCEECEIFLEWLEDDDV